MVATIGFFDGVHCGHRFLIGQLTKEATERGMQSLVVTFAKHPLEVLRPDFRAELLSTCAEKVELLHDAGADKVEVLDFNRELSQMSAHDFMERILRDRMGVKVLFIGYDHKFGRGGQDTFDDYVRYGKELGIEVKRIEELQGDDGHKNSSSVVRNALRQGDVETANAVLGYRYALEGVVVGGFRVGRKIGYPTANIEVEDSGKLVPHSGVYAVKASFFNGHLGGSVSGMMNIGYRPTLDNGDKRSIEVHLFDFNADIYSERIRIEFVAHIRDERKFNSIEELQSQLAADERMCREKCSLSL